MVRHTPPSNKMNAAVKYVKLYRVLAPKKLFLNRTLTKQIGLPRKQTG